MHVPVSAVSLARSMLWLGRARATGVLRVRSDTSTTQFTFVRGAIVARASNANDLRERMWVAFRGDEHRLRFATVELEWAFDGSGDVRDTHEIPSTAALVLHCMRRAAEGLSDGTVEPGFELTAWGKCLLEASGEHTLLAALQLGGPAADGCDEMAETWRALRAFGAIAPPARSRIDYSLLLRKRAELRRSAGARELLDFPPGAAVSPAAARSALRRLSLHLHPDCLGPDAPSSARDLTTEVMQALTRAASSLG